jgi:hypothetical protein
MQFEYDYTDTPETDYVEPSAPEAAPAEEAYAPAEDPTALPPDQSVTPADDSAPVDEAPVEEPVEAAPVDDAAESDPAPPPAPLVDDPSADPSAQDPTQVGDPSATGLEELDPSQSVTPADDTGLDPSLSDDGALQDQPLDSQQEGFVFTEDTSCWCQPGPPSDWQQWQPEAEPDPQSFTPEQYSTEWGELAPDWASQGEDVFTVTEPEVALSEGPLADVVGPGHAADVYWGYQGDTNYCVLYSAGSIISELYGVPVDINEVVSRADANNWLAKDPQTGEVKGVSSEHFDDLLASYGVPSQTVEGEAGAWESLNSALANNQRVILSLDSSETTPEVAATNTTPDPTGTADLGPHAVSITGIDYARGVAIVNDSLAKTGGGLEVPLNVLYESWRDSNFTMTITDVAAPGGSEARAPAGAGDLVASSPGYALMGVTLQPQPVGGWIRQ